MKETYKRALSAVLVYEGGKVDHPADPGGRTNQGVIQRVYNAWRVRRDLPIRDVYLMENTERDAIYKTQYWDAIRGDELPAGIDFVVFDGAVNSGPSQSAKWLQRALGVKVDGHIGESTVRAAAAYPDHDKLVAAICDRRMAFLKALKTWPTFGKGWTSRVNQVRRSGQAWASGSVGPNPTFADGGNRKASIEDAKPAPTKAPADAAAGGGLVSGGIGATLESAKTSLEPLAGSSNIVANVVLALVIAGIALTIGGFAWGYWQRQKAAERADALDIATVTA